MYLDRADKAENNINRSGGQVEVGGSGGELK